MVYVLNGLKKLCSVHGLHVLTLSLIYSLQWIGFHSHGYPDY